MPFGQIYDLAQDLLQSVFYEKIFKNTTPQSFRFNFYRGIDLKPYS